MNDEKLDESLIDRPGFDEEDEVVEDVKKDDDSDLYIAISCFVIVLICSAIAYILYVKKWKK